MAQSKMRRSPIQLSRKGRAFSPFRDAPCGRGVHQHFVDGRGQLLLVPLRDSAVDDALRLDAVVPAELADPVMMQEAHGGGDVQAEALLEIPYEVVASLSNVARNADVLGPLKSEMFVCKITITRCVFKRTCFCGLNLAFRRVFLRARGADLDSLGSSGNWR